MKKIFVLVLSMIFVLVLMVGVDAVLFAPHPTEQPGTIWSTTDGRVSICIPNKDAPLGTIPYGTIKTEGNTVDLVFAMSNHAGCVAVFFPEDHNALGHGVPVDYIEFWTEVSIWENCFVVRVQNTTYFEENTELVFYKVNSHRDSLTRTS